MFIWENQTFVHFSSSILLTSWSCSAGNCNANYWCCNGFYLILQFENLLVMGRYSTNSLLNWGWRWRKTQKYSAMTLTMTTKKSIWILERLWITMAVLGLFQKTYFKVFERFEILVIDLKKTLKYETLIPHFFKVY